MMFTIAYLCDFHTYTPSSKAIGIPLLSITLGACLGVAWELYQLKIKDTIQIGWNDVFRTIAGSIAGGLLGTFL